MSAKHGLAHRFYTGQVSYDFVGHKKFWYSFSAVILAICCIAVGLRGLSLGTEFRGGTDFQVSMPVTESTIDDVRSKVAGFEAKDLEAQVFSLGENAVRIQTRPLTEEETISVRAGIAELANVQPGDVTYTAIGASWGEQILSQALVALAVFITLVMVLIGFWFRNWKMSLAAVIALGHDLVVTIGIYALAGLSVTPATVIAVLTILGYSLYDTVVVFDRVTENTKNLKDSRQTYGEAANLAINQVLIRSLNTTLIGILPVTALLIGGSMLPHSPLEDLGLALFIGMIAGAYSSIFIATPLLVQMKEREPAQVAHRASLARKAERAAAKASRTSGEEDEVTDSMASEKDDEAVSASATAEKRRQRSNLSRAQRKLQKR
ncbi:protein translocase subunit SecF [Arachnia rubra]|jgi:protein-export membrane protein secF|uniref:Protein-export membrane protein SecF n=1 Tax=Arachnia rubra TaxID=1547448 RepID=A0ABX7Y8C3_9ACTN|nr:protein translocase subunit SecF [Arachnia rubra]MBB1570998.1 protein translocase subunit SecF [Propionibacterium sp.]MDO4644267.1 protein translocase subunit SecF [Propionibacteriaceae bacterium]MBB1577497.1 protein translocase subunit SecF [Propionibacterium sp.]QUC09485.1 protein translocase subunit SecF [Arachnia rubra]BCR80978.1 protein translocase subunit SecF [Arachnia rubra]